MMIKYVLATTALSLIVSLGAVIHTQSVEPAHRPAPGGGERGIFAAGRIEGLTQQIELRPEIDGRATEILVREGDQVTSGQVLLRVDDRQQVHEVQLAQAELDLAQAQLERLKNGARQQECVEAASEYAAKLAELERAQLELGRRQGLRREEAIPQKDLDDQQYLVASLKSRAAAAKARADLVEAPPREDELEIARARVAAARARLELAKVQHDRTQLKSPISGQVLKIEAEPGELVGPASRELAVIVADTSRFRVRAFVEELDAPRVEVGLKATIHVDGQPDQKYTGTVTRLSPRMSRKSLYSDDPAERYDTKTREVWIDLDGGEGLVVGLRVDVMIHPHAASTVSDDHARRGPPDPAETTDRRSAGARRSGRPSVKRSAGSGAPRTAGRPAQPDTRHPTLSSSNNQQPTTNNQQLPSHDHRQHAKADQRTPHPIGSCSDPCAVA